MTDAKMGPVAQIMKEKLEEAEGETSLALRDTEALMEYLAETQIEERMDLVKDLMRNPPRLADIVSREDMVAMSPLMRAFLAALLICLGNKTMASKASGVSRDTHYSWLKRKGPKCEVYQRVLPEVEEAAVDHLEAIVMDRAVFGVKQYKFNKNGDHLVHPVTKEPYYEYQYSDLLLERLMRAKKPETWKSDNNLTVDVSTIMSLGEDDLTRLARGENPKKVLTGK